MTLVNTETGEIVEPGTGLAPVDKSSAASVITYLSQARDWLATCVELTGPQEIAYAKAQIATAAEATKQLGLSKEIRDDATEMVRRFEYTLRKATTKAQEAGEVRTREDGLVPGGRAGKPDTRSTSDDRPRPRDFFTGKQEYEDANAMGALSEDDFEEALAEARAEGNLSRANVAKKARERVKGQKSNDGRMNRDQRADLIEELAAQGYSSRQMPSQVGVTEETVRQIAREYGIEIPADKAISRTRRVNSTNVVVNTATALEGLVAGVELIDFDALDIEEVRQWATSLTDSTRTLSRFAKQIKEMTQ